MPALPATHGGNMRHVPDDQLVLAIARGGESAQLACSELARRHYGWSLVVCLRALRGDLLLAEDARHDAWSQLLSSAGSFVAGRPFRPWFGMVCKNKCRAIRRKRARHPAPLLVSYAAKDTRDPLDAVVRAEDRARVLRALHELYPRYRQVLRLRFSMGLGLDAIASCLGTSKPNCSVLLCRALARLRALVLDDREGDQHP